MTGAGAQQSIPLEAFLAVLPAEEAAEARRAANEIDALEREIGPPGWLERHLAGLGLIALLLFTAGVLLLAGLAAGVLRGIGFVIVVPLIAVFPALMLAYVWSVRGRTRLDRQKMELNEHHFLPRGGVYFGERDGERLIMRVKPPEKSAPNLRERAEALHAEATRRRWWW